MPRPRKRPTTLAFCTLEPRLLLDANPTGTWIGQDKHDLAGPSSTLGPDGVQDIHIAVANLPAARTVASGKIEPLGGGEWDYNGPYGPWAAAFVRTPGSTTADLYVDPYQVETGRQFSIALTYDNGTTVYFWVQGGAADPNLRMPGESLQVAWVGQDGQDFVGSTASVGPDGIQDAHLVFSNLSPGVAIDSGTIDGALGDSWELGNNRQALKNVNVIPRANDPTKADVYINPSRNMNGETLTVSIAYANGKTDTAAVVGGPTDSGLKMPGPASLPTIRNGVAVQWVGQDGTNLTGPGDVRVNLSGLPAGVSVVDAELTDQAGGTWIYQKAGSTAPFYVDPFAAPLGFQRTNDAATNAVATFAPIRNETGGTLTLRLVLSDGSIAVTSFAGGAADVGLRSAGISATSIVAHPGDDLNALANAYGTVHLSAGEYDLNRQLILSHAVSITADPGATLVFTQPSSDPAWTAAIKIHKGHTTLDGFAVRFSGPVRWDWSVGYGPAVIGSSDDHDAGQTDPKAGIILRHLDVQTPPPASAWEQAPILIRLTSGTGGRIESNTLRGGSTEVMNGPWTIVNNNYVGTVPGTFTSAAFVGHYTHDLVLTGNRVQPVGNSGKTWRFLVLTQSGIGDLIQDNSVVGVGPMDSDTVPSDNANEIILTEAYRLHFEGSPAAVSSNGRILQIPAPQGPAARAGDVVSILSGPQAGQWFRIAQAIDPQTYLMQDALPAGSYAISIATGFVGETFQRNTVDARGSTTAGDLVLVGNHYGTQVIDNTFIGGGVAFKITAAPTESPVAWGWSHAPFLGAAISGNTISDTVSGGLFDVEHSAATKSDKGRVYFSASVTNNTATWSDAFLAAHPNPVALTVGDPLSLDPGELVLSMSGNQVQTSGTSVPANTLVVPSATINGSAMTDKKLTLPRVGGGGGGGSANLPAPADLALVHDNGLSPYDQLTNDAHLSFTAVSGATGYAYRVGSSGAYTSIGNVTTFLPAGLAQGSNTIFVRALNTVGNAGPDVSITIRYDTTLPEASPPVLTAATDSGLSNSDEITSVTKPQFTFTGDPNDKIRLFRNGVEIGNTVGAGTIRDPGVPGDGTYFYSVVRLDPAGNVSLSPAAVVTILTSPPPMVSGLTAGADGSVRFQPIAANDIYEYRVGTAGSYLALGRNTSFVPLNLASGANLVFVHAVGPTGIVGPDSGVIVNVGPSAAPTPGPSNAPPTGLWRGQDRRDVVGPGPGAGADGIQDIHIVVSGLRTDVAVAAVTITTRVGGRWATNSAGGAWQAGWVQAPGGSAADLYIDPPSRPTGRTSYSVDVTYADGTDVTFAVAGGVFSPRLRMPGPPRRARANIARPIRAAAVHVTSQSWANRPLRGHL